MTMEKKNKDGLITDSEKLTPKRIVTLVLQGLIIGAGGILPGVSGGILCVAFGLYMPLMQLFANPFKEFPRTWKKWFFVGVGGCLGLLLFAVVLDALFETSENMAKSLFAGLIAGTVPSLFREAQNDPKKKDGKLSAHIGVYKIIAIVLGFIATTVLFKFLAGSEGSSFAINPSPFWFGVCGFIIGMGFTIPGLTSSTVLIFLGLLQPMLDGALAFDFGVIIPVGLGVVLSILLLSRLVNFIFDRWYTVAFYVVIGMIFASTIAIIPRSVAGIGELVICIAAAIAACIGALFLSRALSKYEK